ncbi:hypothetical protein BD410DRAFT_403353 [Rickenella mellea]|uniref:Uncharacterized protein n=1 Tax=Rickenella mellea TaxID=50990 RepID=A0A4Y7PXK2_9AGAM|nr:hypothetical protein BD410DRAFT_403353 [Rickenella mellea]
MAELQQYWALPFPTAIHILLCTSTLFSIIACALSIGQIKQGLFLVIIYAPLTFITIVHHGTLLFIVRRTTPRRLRETPKISEVLVRKRHLFTLGFLLLFWFTGVGWAIAFDWFWINGVSLANIVFGVLEFIVVLVLLVICIRDRRRFLRSGGSGKLGDVEASNMGTVLEPIKKPKVKNTVVSSMAKPPKPKVACEGTGSSEGSQTLRSPDSDGSTTIGVEIPIPVPAFTKPNVPRSVGIAPTSQSNNTLQEP